MTRARLLDQTAGWVLATCRPHPLRVAVDGIDAAGKTTFADELAEVIGQFGRPVVRASIDDFHRPRTERYQHGKDSPQGYYLDSLITRSWYPACCCLSARTATAGSGQEPSTTVLTCLYRSNHKPQPSMQY